MISLPACSAWKKFRKHYSLPGGRPWALERFSAPSILPQSNTNSSPRIWNLRGNRFVRQIFDRKFPRSWQPLGNRQSAIGNPLKLCDVTQFYSPLSGGVKRYVHEKI